MTNSKYLAKPHGICIARETAEQSQARWDAVAGTLLCPRAWKPKENCFTTKNILHRNCLSRGLKNIHNNVRTVIV